MQTVQKDSLPQKTRWSQRAISRYLCADRKTVKHYAEVVAPLIADYRAECPRTLDGGIRSGMSLSSYQFWVVCQIVKLSRAIQSELNGTNFRQVVRSTVVKKSHLLSRDAWQSQPEQSIAS